MALFIAVTEVVVQAEGSIFNWDVTESSFRVTPALQARACVTTVNGWSRHANTRQAGLNAVAEISVWAWFSVFM
jgi:hypothetical protein